MIAIFTQTDFIKALPVTPDGVILGKPVFALDGRVAVEHGFSDRDQAYLTAHGATMCESLPSDFVVAEV